MLNSWRNVHEKTRTTQRHSAVGSLRSVAANLCFIAVFVPLCTELHAQTEPTTKPGASDFELREWVVMVCSPYHGKANQDVLFGSTFPASSDSRRVSAPAEKRSEPQPMGVIRLFGASAAKVDVKLGIHNGRPLASLPKAKAKNERLLWDNLALSAELPTTDSMDSASRPESAEAGSWISLLRQSSSAFVHNDNGIDRFLAYDVELGFSSPLKITGGTDFTYAINNGGATAIEDVILYKHDGGTWRTAELTTLPPGQSHFPSTRPTRPKSEPTTLATMTSTTRPAMSPAGVAATTPATTPATEPATQASVQPSTQPSSQPATSPSKIELHLTASAATQPAELLDTWKTRLVGEGLSDVDAGVIVRILQDNALDAHRLTAVFELDPAELDRLLPLEVIPEPKKITRLGLVILKDADPGVAGEIDELVKQLGSDDWSKREAAYKSIHSLGKAAKPQLEKASKGTDIEVVWRAERLLAGIDKPTAAAD